MQKSQTNRVYSTDVEKTGGYLYTNKEIYSAVIATQKQTDEMVHLMKSLITPDTTILDIGCGDGVYTIELFNQLHPKKIIGFDMVKEAIRVAKQKHEKKTKGKVTFEVSNVYTMSDQFKKQKLTVGVLRGVLHHLENPRRAIQEISKTLDSVVVLEPNGYNPILKIIEKTSPYHVAHGEKSYFPPLLDKLFAEAGFGVLQKKYFSIVPYFFPTWITKILKKIEPFFENIPLINRIYCGAILIHYHK